MRTLLPCIFCRYSSVILHFFFLHPLDVSYSSAYSVLTIFVLSILFIVWYHNYAALLIFSSFYVRSWQWRMPVDTRVVGSLFSRRVIFCLSGADDSLSGANRKKNCYFMYIYPFDNVQSFSLTEHSSRNIARPNRCQFFFFFPLYSYITSTISLLVTSKIKQRSDN